MSGQVGSEKVGSENRRQIFEMLAAGKINADEAERLMAAMEKPEVGSERGAFANSTSESGAGESERGGATTERAKPKYLRVSVDVDDKPGKPPTKVNIRVPMMLLRSGVKLAGLMPQGARAKVEEAMRKNGIPMDLSQMKPENLDEMVDMMQDMTVDVDEDDARVRIAFE